MGFSYLQEQVFTTPGFVYGGWMTFLTYVTYALCGWAEGAVTRSLTRHAAIKVRSAATGLRAERAAR